MKRSGAGELSTGSMSARVAAARTRYSHACDAASFASRTTRNRAAGASWRARTSWVIGSDRLSSTRSKAACSKRDDRAVAARHRSRRSASCESESPRTRTGSPSGRGSRSGERARPPPTRLFRSCGVSGRRNRSNTVTQSAANCSTAALAPRGTMAMNRSIARMVGSTDTDVRGRALNRSSSATKSASVNGGSRRKGAFSVA